MKHNKNVPFSIVTSAGEFQRHTLLLKALEYPIYNETFIAMNSGRGMEKFSYLTYDGADVVRSRGFENLYFSSIEDFLIWYLDDESQEDKRIKAIEAEIRSLELEKAGLIAKKTGAVC